jgi:DNA-binding NarL/FixJ family response regulator
MGVCMKDCTIRGKHPFTRNMQEMTVESKLNGIVQKVGISAEGDTITRPGRRANEGAPTVILVEKRSLMRDLLSRCLALTAGFEVLATTTVDECIEVAKTHDGAVILISVAGDPDSGETQQILRRATQALEAPIVVLRDGEELHKVTSVLQAGARGYVSTSMSLDVTIEALRLVRAGGQFFPASYIVGMGDANSAAPASSLQSHLSGIFTARQAAVVTAVCQGKANKIIAYELKMRESTVKVHLRSIMKKLKATNRTEVAYITNQLVANNHSGLPTHRMT